MATLILEDSTVMYAKSFGAQGDVFGEIVFNTSMAGYQEIITDPSYAGQVIVMTYPEIGNYGINNDDFESLNPALRALVVKEYCKNESHYKSKITLGNYLKERNVIGIEGLDTRSLTKKIREAGTMSCFITTRDLSDEEIKQKIEETKNYKPNPDIVFDVTTKESYIKGKGNPIKLAFIDYGAKYGIVKSLVKRGCEVKVYPANIRAHSILKEDFDAVFLSNGPGDPKDCKNEIATIQELIGKIPIFGICLGYQLLAIVSGAKTYKLKYGHRGGNHPVINLETNKVMMSSQNHGYAVDVESLSEIMTPTYKNLNDDTLEGFKIDSLKIHAVQFHPEAAPGPDDAAVIFDEWIELMKKYQKVRA